MAREGRLKRLGPFSPTAGGDKRITHRVKYTLDALAHHDTQIGPPFKLSWHLNLESISLVPLRSNRNSTKKRGSAPNAIWERWNLGAQNCCQSCVTIQESEERLTDSCDNSPGKEEGRADVPQAGLIEGVSWRVHASSDGWHHLLQRRGGKVLLQWHRSGKLSVCIQLKRLGPLLGGVYRRLNHELIFSESIILFLVFFWTGGENELSLTCLSLQQNFKILVPQDLQQTSKEDKKISK